MKKSGSRLPAVLTLMIFAPLITEVLPGATRFSSLFVFPIEILVWGGGAVMIREIVRRNSHGWISMLMLALALSVAEEWLIQQTSLAPMVIHIKGITYARAAGINYVYFLWALVYESVFVVFIPVGLTELIFRDRRKDPWLSNTGMIVIFILFLAGAFLAWYSWTQLARPKVFHVAGYNPPAVKIIFACLLIAFLIFISVSRISNKLLNNPEPMKIFSPAVLFIFSFLWAILLYGLATLAFGIAPSFPPVLAVLGGVILAIAPVYFLPKWLADRNWEVKHQYSIISGVMSGSMIVSFVGFMGPATPDLYFKIAVDMIAIILLIRFARIIRKRKLSNVPS